MSRLCVLYIMVVLLLLYVRCGMLRTCCGRVSDRLRPATHHCAPLRRALAQRATSREFQLWRFILYRVYAHPPIRHTLHKNTFESHFLLSGCPLVSLGLRALDPSPPHRLTPHGLLHADSSAIQFWERKKGGGHKRVVVSTHRSHRGRRVQ